MNPFWIFAVLAVILLIDVILFIKEEYAWSVLVMVVSIIAAYYFLPDVAEFVRGAGWQKLLMYVGIYIGVGVIISLLKWVFFNLKITNEMKEVRTVFEREQAGVEDPLKQMHDELKHRISDFKPNNDLSDEENLKAFRRYKFYEKYTRKTNSSVPHLSYWEFHDVEKFQDALTPKAKNNVGKITLWIFQWPVVIIATLFDDILMKIGKWVSRTFDLIFSGISRHLVGNAVKDL